MEIDPRSRESQNLSKSIGRTPYISLALFAAALVSLPVQSQHSRNDQAQNSSASQTARVSQPSVNQHVNVVFSGGHETDPADRGRPVALVAGALGVPPQVFRDAFSHVHPAPPGRGPSEAEARQNKDALMSALEKYGVTNDRLDEVSNKYRYVRSRGEMWPTKEAEAYAVVQRGVVTNFVITNKGCGYSSEPEISIPGLPGTRVKAELSFGPDFDKNGSISNISIAR